MESELPLGAFDNHVYNTSTPAKTGKFWEWCKAFHQKRKCADEAAREKEAEVAAEDFPLQTDPT